MNRKPTITTLFSGIRNLVRQSKENLYTVINTTLVETYYHVGRLIVEFQQQGNARAGYAAGTLRNVSSKLTKEFGKGFSIDNLEHMRRFYNEYKGAYASFLESERKSETVSRRLTNAKNTVVAKSETLSRKSVFTLSWSHYLLLMKIGDLNERSFYTIEACNEGWSVRELQRQFDSALYERLMLSRSKKKVKELSRKGHVIAAPADIIKDPYILDFLELQEQEAYSESDLERAIISKLKDFLNELGKGFLFVDRQKRIRVDNEDYYVDLVFYRRILRCFVLIDLKIGSLKHQDLGQLQMYVNYYDQEIKSQEENKTIGIILCKTKKENTIRYTLGNSNTKCFSLKNKC